MVSTLRGNTQILWEDETDLQNKIFKNIAALAFSNKGNAVAFETKAELRRNANMLTISKAGGYVDLYDFSTGKIQVGAVSTIDPATFTAHDIQDGGNSTSIVSANAGTDEMTMGSDLFQTNDLLIGVGGGLPTGVVTTAVYYVSRVSSGVIKLATSAANLAAGTFLNITADGSGTAYKASVKPATSTATKPDVVSQKSTNTTAPFGGIILPLVSNIYSGYSIEYGFRLATPTNLTIIRAVIQDADFSAGTPKLFYHNASAREVLIQNITADGNSPSGNIYVKAVYNANRWHLFTSYLIS